jgi:hypothetical protein
LKSDRGLCALHAAKRQPDHMRTPEAERVYESCEAVCVVGHAEETLGWIR